MQRICVYCGHSAGHDAVYAQNAADAGRALAARRIGVVFGGGASGMMGAVADAALAAGGEVIGIVPDGLFAAESLHRGLTRAETVPISLRSFPI